jgi:hypothetical protein
MKKSAFFGSILCLFVVPQVSGQITMNSSGKVAVGGNPTSDNLHVSGNLHSTLCKFNNLISTSSYGNIMTQWEDYGITLRPTSNNNSQLGSSSYYWKNAYINHVYPDNSDLRRKENVRSMEGSVNKVIKLRGVLFDRKPENIMSIDLRSKIDDPDYILKQTEESKNLYGFIAQEVLEVLPEIVHHDDSTDYYSVDYLQLIPLLTEAIKEQQTIIENLQAKIDNFLSDKNESYLKSINTGSSLYSAEQSEALLFQNQPNPYKESTKIDFFIPEDNGEAAIFIYDLQGQQKTVYPLEKRGKSAIEIQGSELKPGIYLYSLIVDNQEISTKRMILLDQ